MTLMDIVKNQIEPKLGTSANKKMLIFHFDPILWHLPLLAIGVVKAITIFHAYFCKNNPRYIVYTTKTEENSRFGHRYGLVSGSAPRDPARDKRGSFPLISAAERGVNRVT